MTLSPTVPTYVQLDKGKFRQILINLLGNAVKFTEAGSVSLRTRAEALPDNMFQLFLEVEDTGSGIPTDKIETIFEPFAQVGHSPAKLQGTGLGLAICRQFTQLMGGEITVHTVLGTGSVFRLKLPVAVAKASELDQTREIPWRQTIGLAAGQPDWRILIVEDEVNNRLLLRSILEAVGFDIREAVNGKEAIQQFQAWHPHLIWMDRRMPVMDGLAATQRIRKLPGGDQVKIIDITASVFQDENLDALKAGLDDFVQKPYQSEAIFACMAKHLGVQYLYGDQAVAPEEATRQLLVGLTPEALTRLPEELLQDLQAAVLSLQPEIVMAAIAPIRNIDVDVATALTSLAKNLHYDRILELLDLALHKTD